MTLEELLATVVREAIGPEPTEDDGLALMIVLHTHRLLLAGATVSDRPDMQEIEALTQRAAAEVIASAWPDRSNKTWTKHAEWYWAFNTRTPYEIVEDVSGPWVERVARARDALLRIRFLRGVEPEP